MYRFVSDIFTAYNQKYFKGRLPPIPIELTHKDDFKGAIFVNPHLRLVLSIPFLNTTNEGGIRGVILHEMIHYFFKFFNIPDESSIFLGHSPRFRRVARRIGQREGIEIPLK